MENEKNEIKPASFRVDIDTTTKFRGLASSLGLSQDKMMKELIASYELEQAKSGISDRAKEIEEFQHHINRIQNMFLNSLEINQNSEIIIREQFREQLNRKQDLIINLQDQLKEAKEGFKDITDKYINASDLSKKLYGELEQLKDILGTKESLLNEYKAKIDTLTSLVTEYTEYKEKFKESDKIISDLNYANNNLEMNNKELKLDIENLTKKLEIIESNASFYKNELDLLKSEHKKEIEKNEFKYNDEILKIKSEYEDEIKKLELRCSDEALKTKSEYESEIGKLESKYNNTLSFEKDSIALEKDKIIFVKDKEIENLKSEIEKLKKNKNKTNKATNK